MIRPSTRGDRQGGAAAVEMALLAPLLVLLAYGVIEFGIIFAQDLGMGNGAREGARYAATSPTLRCADSSNDNVIERTRLASETLFLPTDLIDISVYVGPDEATATTSGEVCNEATTTAIDPPCDGSDPGDRVYVMTRYGRGLFIPFGPNDDNFEVNGTGVFQCEFS